MIRTDVVVVGAGASGLAAARDLSLAGFRVAVLDGRARLGGRIDTEHDPSWTVPIDLGPEFIHGPAEETLAIVRAARLVAIRLEDAHWKKTGRGWTRQSDFWAAADRVTNRMRRTGRDRSVADFLRAHPSLSRNDRDLVRSLVEGYDAAPANRVGEHSIATRGGSGPHDQFRLLSGYDGVAGWLASSGDLEKISFRYETVARDVRWGPGRVEVEAVTRRGTERFAARAAVLTPPVGVWKAVPGDEGAIRLLPEVASRQRALERVDMGTVVKLVLRFREPFWRGAPGAPAGASPRGETPQLGFLHDSRAAFPTWWSMEPAEAPILTAWAGGPAAQALSGLPEEELAGRAVETIARLLGVPRGRVGASLEAWRSHDWQGDPFSRGAYSYLGVGGVPARAVLARPVRGTLFFAGEATDREQSGTVAGAISSGRRAARQAVRSLTERRHRS
ncbi:MAG: NAD(P)/FAD-dependent oxidoreductase [Acidobacteriota bacterium]